MSERVMECCFEDKTKVQNNLPHHQIVVPMEENNITKPYLVTNKRRKEKLLKPVSRINSSRTVKIKTM